MRKLKVLQISNYMYPHIGGIEQVARDIADCFVDVEDIEQKIICFNADASDGTEKCKKKETVHDEVDGVEVIRCGCFTKIASQSLSLIYSKKLKEVMNRFNPDIVILHYPNPFVVQLLQSYYKCPFSLVVYWHLDITKQKILGKFFHGQTLRLLKRANQIVATSPNYIEGSPYLSTVKDKCVVIPNSIRVDRLKPTETVYKKVEEIKRANENKILCFSIGRHVEYKGYTYLIQASKFLDTRFHICIGGTGKLTEQLKEEAKSDEKIEFLGRLSDEEMIAYYMACDIFCFPSITKNEAFGIALAEGMYFGKPAVTFHIPGSGVNYVNKANETGIECLNGDIQEYANALRILADDAELRYKYGKNATERVINLFMFKQFKENINQLVTRVKKISRN